MIIEEICVHNFGVYNGRHTLSLEPISNDRPVVIIGALNGSGKTTLLDAMQLALYGKLGTYSSRGVGSYDEFLHRSINHRASEHDGAAVELVFRQARDGIESRYRVRRTWQVVDGKIREVFDVLRDGTPDKLLAEHWYEYVEEILPSRIAPLFFFDGEKVVELADAAQAPALLRVAIQSLLGLDIVQQLRVDLDVLSRRKRSDLSSDEDRAALEAMQRELDELEAQRDGAFQHKAACNGAVEKAQAKLSNGQRDFQENGGSLFQQRAALEAAQKSTEAEKSQIEDELRDLAAGEAPLLLVSRQLHDIADIDQRERETANARAVLAVMTKRDSWLLKLVRKQDMPGHALENIEEALSSDRAKRKAAGERDEVYKLSAEARLLLDEVRRGLLVEAGNRANGKLQELERVLIRITDLERKLAAIPNAESIQPYIVAIGDAEARLREATLQLDSADRELAELDARHTTLRRSLVRALEVKIDRHHQQSDAARILDFAGKASQNLERFEQAVVRHHIRRVESLVLNSLQTLLRKERLITEVRIDPATFIITLTGSDGRTFSMERLSAGERQLLAVSMLWGLAQASGRPIPTIIDTPLGRLDSEHRRHLVDRYFPKASHQVILLSTDTEIDAAHYRRLKPAVSHSYTLTFDPANGGTRVIEGLEFADGIHP